MVSVLGSSYFQPIADLVDRLTRGPKPRPNAVQAGYYENGYAVSVVLLLVAMFESYIVRVRYINKGSVPNTTRSPIDVLRLLYPKYRRFTALTDVYVLRDLIFHNHLWEIEFAWGGPHAMVLHGAARHPAFGDKKYVARVNSSERRTKALKLSIIPTRVDRRDAKRVFQALWHALLYLEAKNRNQCYVSHINVRFRQQVISFASLSAVL